MLRHKLLSTGSEITELRGQRLLIAEERLLSIYIHVHGPRLLSARDQVFRVQERDD